MYRLLQHLAILRFCHRVYLWVSYDSQSKQWLFPQTALVVVMEMGCVFFEVGTEFLSII
jgi:hypothetical protein